MQNYVVLLNWNGWKDTIECLESVFRLQHPSFGVVICDNASENGSLEKIKAWADGTFGAMAGNSKLAHLTSPPVTKPIRYQELTRERAESGICRHDLPLTLIQNEANLGFAAGTNVGLRYALRDLNCKFFWMLNNDTVVEPAALSALENHMLKVPKCGLCGSLNISYYNPREVQSLGGKQYNRWTSRARKSRPRTIGDVNTQAEHMDFLSGASMLASRGFLETVGLMEESYFLYFEEIDWAMRAKGKFELGFASQSVIYHKEGATIGSHSDRMRRSLLSDEYLSRNRVLFTKRFYRWALPSVLVSVVLTAIHRLCHGDAIRAKAILTFTFRGLAENIPRTADYKASE